MTGIRTLVYLLGRQAPYRLAIIANLWQAMAFTYPFWGGGCYSTASWSTEEESNLRRRRMLGDILPLNYRCSISIETNGLPGFQPG